MTNNNGSTIRNSRKPKVSAEYLDVCKERAKAFCTAIQDYRTQRLFAELLAAKVITESYSFEAFKTDIKRMRASCTGLMKQPALIGPICEKIGYSIESVFSDIQSVKQLSEAKIAKHVVQELKKSEK